MAAGLTGESLQVEVRLIETALVVKVDGTSEGLPVLDADRQVGQPIDFDLEIVDGAAAAGDQGRGAEVELSDLSITHESAAATAERSEQAKDDDVDQKSAPRETRAPRGAVTPPLPRPRSPHRRPRSSSLPATPTRRWTTSR